jgi:hypothetical protein
MALVEFEGAGMLVYGVAIRHVLAKLIGDEDGKALGAQADARARKMKVLDLSATARLLMMGLQV